jgi:hypothetical protein
MKQREPRTLLQRVLGLRLWLLFALVSAVLAACGSAVLGVDECDQPVARLTALNTDSTELPDPGSMAKEPEVADMTLGERLLLDLQPERWLPRYQSLEPRHRR